MILHTCNKCGDTKDIKLFRKSKTIKSGYTNMCSACNNKIRKIAYKKRFDKEREYSLAYREQRKNILEHHINKLYSYMKIRVEGKESKTKYHGRYVGYNICDKSEFIEKAKNSWLLRAIFEYWIAHGRQRKHAPSVDRIDNKKGYEIENIQFLSFSENSKKGQYENNRM